MSYALKKDISESSLIQELKITRDQIEQAKKLAKTNGQGILGNMVQLGVINNRQVVEIQAECFGINLVRLANYPIDPLVLETIPEEIRNKYQVLPLCKQGNLLTLATSSLFQAQGILQELQKNSKLFINLVLAYPSEIAERISSMGTPTGENIDNLLADKAKELSIDEGSIDKKMIEDPNGPVAQVLHQILSQAVQNGASDVHIEPLPKTLRIRYREDGILREVRTFDKVFVNAFAAATKVMASMDIAETRLPQDGAISMVVSNRKVDFRVATYPTEHGEKIVARILDSNKDLSIENLCLSPQEQVKLLRMISQRQGIVLVAGPTGSGKTTTLYSILNFLNNPKINILTIEDPIEYRFAGIIQAQVNIKKGFTFAKGLRAMLRLDPNVILVGEMRDLETAEIGIEAALTGHLVFSTIHANSASQTIMRLKDMGVEQYAIGSALQGVVSQRLVRRICEKCKMKYRPTPEELQELGHEGPPPPFLFKGKGCLVCHNEGYKGRVAIMEIMEITNDMRPVITKEADSGILFQSALSHGMKTIQFNTREKVLAGFTTVEEYSRVLGKGAH